MNTNRICIVLSAAVLIAPTTLIAQSGSTSNANPATPANTTQSSGTGSQAAGMTPMRMDKMFLRKAAEGGMTEIQFSQLALQKSSNDGVKQYAQKMIDDHTQLNNDMKPFDDQMGVVPPSSLPPKEQAMYDKLGTKSGADFDKGYLMAMTKDHHKDQREFAKEIATTSNQDLKTAVTKGKGVIDDHTRMVEELDKTNGVTMGHGAGQ